MEFDALGLTQNALILKRKEKKIHVLSLFHFSYESLVFLLLSARNAQIIAGQSLFVVLTAVLDEGYCRCC